MLHRAGEYLFWRARYAEALALTQRAVELRQQALGATHPDVAESMNNLGVMHSDQGHSVEALTLHQQALSIWEQALGPEDPSVSLGLNNLADIYRLQGRYSEALPLFQRALAVGRTNAWSHPFPGRQLLEQPSAGLPGAGAVRRGAAVLRASALDLGAGVAAESSAPGGLPEQPGRTLSGHNIFSSRNPRSCE